MIAKRMTPEQMIEAAQHVRASLLKTHPNLQAPIDAYCEQLQASLAAGETSYATRRAAAMAYRIAMPELQTIEGVRAHIDAVAQGVCLGIFDGKEASALLYAAQIAISSRNRKEVAA